jgi:hypothetical protein
LQLPYSLFWLHSPFRAWLRPPTFWVPLYLLYCSCHHSPLPPPFDCFRFHFSFYLTYPFRVFLRIQNILHFAENEFIFEMLKYLWFSHRC